jgi:hypothetical protein
MEQSFKLIVAQPVMKFLAFYGTLFVTVFRRDIPGTLRSILISSFCLRLGFPSGLSPPDFPTKNVYAFLISSVRATCPTHPILLYLLTPMSSGEAYKVNEVTRYTVSYSLLPLSPSYVQILSSAQIFGTTFRVRLKFTPLGVFYFISCRYFISHSIASTSPSRPSSERLFFLCYVIICNV